MSETKVDPGEVDEIEVPVLEEKPKTNKPPYMVVGDKFYAQTSEGELSIPLRFKTKLLRQIRDSDATDEIDQVFILLDGLGDKRTADALDELDAFDTVEFAMKFFAAWQEKNKARLGEASRSSN